MWESLLRVPCFWVVWLPTKPLLLGVYISLRWWRVTTTATLRIARWRRWRQRRRKRLRHDGRRDTTTMAADDDDNEVDGNGATGEDDGYVNYYNIVKLIILLICLHYNFYRRRLPPPGEQTSRGSQAGAMQENIWGGGEDSSLACCSRRVSLTPWFSPSSCRHNRLVETVLSRVLYIPWGTEDEFWRGIDENRPTKFLTTAFSDKNHSNSKNVKTKINKMMSWIENGP